MSFTQDENIGAEPELLCAEKIMKNVLVGNKGAFMTVDVSQKIKGTFYIIMIQ